MPTGTCVTNSMGRRWSLKIKVISFFILTTYPNLGCGPDKLFSLYTITERTRIDID